MKNACAFSYSRSRRGFALSEVMVSLFIVTIVISAIGLLAKQVMTLQKTSKQAGTLVDIRMKTASIANDTGRWLGKLRTSTELSGLFNNCIPSNDPSIAVSYDCPDKEGVLYNENGTLIDEELGTLSAGFDTVSSTKVVDASGQLFAGTTDDPHYLDAGGAVCTQADKSKCDFKSVGYFMMENSSGDPGAVNFVVKVEKMNSPGTTPIKPQYINMAIGTSWRNSNVQCPSGSVRMGIEPDGSPYCAPTTNGCQTNQIAVGVNPDGTPNCSTAPNCPSGSFVTVQDGVLTCKQATSPCPEGSAHLGYYSVTNSPICSSSVGDCGDNKMQTGVTISGDSVSPVCKVLPNCTGKKLSYNGSDFSCVTDTISTGQSCSDPNQVVKGINSDGTLNCIVPSGSSSSSNNGSCPSNQVMVGFTNTGAIKCESVLPTNCTDGQVVTVKIDNNNQKTLKCENPGTVSTFDCNSQTKGLIRLDVSSNPNKHQRCNGNNWVDVSLIEDACVNKRSGILQKDSVSWCPANFPTLYSCKVADDSAPGNLKTLDGKCKDDGECLAIEGNLLRTDLGPDFIYLETVKKDTSNGSVVNGCWAYDKGHAHNDYRLDIMCCK